MTDYLDNDPKPLINPQSLRNVASWLDTYDCMARLLFDIIELNPEVVDKSITPEALAACREACSGTSVQDDLRRWADEMEANK